MVHDFAVFKYGTWRFVLTPTLDRDRSGIRDANFMGTGMALCGILRRGEKLANFVERKERVQQERQAKKSKTSKTKK